MPPHSMALETSPGITALIHARLGTTYCAARIKSLCRPQVFIQADAPIAPRDICTGSIDKIAGYHANLACSRTTAEQRAQQPELPTPTPTTRGKGSIPQAGNGAAVTLQVQPTTVTFYNWNSQIPREHD